MPTWVGVPGTMGLMLDTSNFAGSCADSHAAPMIRIHNRRITPSSYRRYTCRSPKRSDPLYEYSIYQPADAVAVSRILGEAFSCREPIGIAAGVTAPEFEHFVGLLAPDAAEQQLTTVARDTTTGKIVGVMLTEDSATPPPGELDTLGQKFTPILEFLHELEAEHRAGGLSPRPGEWLHLFLLA